MYLYKFWVPCTFFSKMELIQSKTSTYSQPLKGTNRLTVNTTALPLYLHQSLAHICFGLTH